MSLPHSHNFVLPWCKNHEFIFSQYCCESCQEYFCKDCIKSRSFGGADVAYICKDCGGRCVDVRPAIDEEAGVFRNPQSFWEQIPQIFVYPFRGKGPYLLAGGLIFFSLLDFLKFMPMLGGLIAFFLYFANVACCINIIRSSIVTNSDEPPDWPDFTRLSDWFMPAVLIFAAVFICYAPSLYYFHETRLKDAFWGLLVAIGSYLFPMVFLNICLRETVGALNPLTNVISIIRTIVPYTMLVLFLLILVFVKYMMELFFSSIPILGIILKSGLTIYLIFVSMRAFGLFYRTHRAHLLFD